MQVTVNGITAKVEWSGFRKSRTEQGPRVVTRYQVAYFDADGFADSVMGGFVVTGGKARNLPRHACPTNPVLYALSAEVDYAAERDDASAPVTPPALPQPPILTFDTAVVEVVYGNLTWPQINSDDPGGDQSFQLESQPNEPLLNMDCELDYGGAATGLSNKLLYFQSDDSKVMDVNGRDSPPFTRWEGLDVWRITRHNFPNLPWAKMRSLKNRVNQTPFLGQPMGCVRFANARTTATMTGDGLKCQRFEMVFEVKDQDWNATIRHDTFQYDVVTIGTALTSSPSFVYRYDDLSALLT